MICISCGTQFPPPGECPECHWDADKLLSPDSVCKPGDVLDSRFAIIGHLGSGRFGVSIWATDLKRKCDVVLKFIHPAFLPTPPHYKRFIDGMSFLTDSIHPASAKLLDVGVMNREVYVSNEYLDGRTLADLISQRVPSQQPFTLVEIYPILKEVASSLVESPTMFHGAICPENIFIQSGHIKLTGCGLAVNLPEAVVMYRLASMPDRNRYVAPEIQNATGIGARGDVYALGVILAEMLSLNRFDPQQCTDVSAEMSISAEEPEGLVEIIRKAVATNPRDRFRDAEALLTAISDTAALPAPQFNRSWADGTAADNEPTGTQEDRTAQIVMKDVIQQHYDEVTAVGRNPLQTQREEKPKVPAPPKPSSSGSKASKRQMNTPPPPVHHHIEPAADSEQRLDPSMAQSDDNAAASVIDLDDTMDDIPDITDEFEMLEEEMLDEVDGPEFKNLETGQKETTDFSSPRRSVSRSRLDNEKTVNERGYLLMNDDTPPDEATSKQLQNLNEEAAVSGLHPLSSETADSAAKAEASPVGIDPRFLRAAEKLESEKQHHGENLPADTDADRLEGINPRFLRAAKALKDAGQASGSASDAASPFESNDEEDWRTRLSQELADNEESMVSFLPGDITAGDTVDQNALPAINKPKDASASSRRAAPTPPPPPPVSMTSPAKGAPSAPAPPTLNSRRGATPPPPPPVRKP